MIARWHPIAGQALRSRRPPPAGRREQARDLDLLVFSAPSHRKRWVGRRVLCPREVPAQGVGEENFQQFLDVGVSSTDRPRSSTNPRALLHRNRLPPVEKTGSPDERREVVRRRAPSARRTAWAWATAPAESPCTHSDATLGASRTAWAAIASASSSSAPGSTAFDQPAVGVPAVGEPLVVRRPAGRRRQREQPRAREAEHRQGPGPGRAPRTPAPRRRSPGGTARRAASRSGRAIPRPPRSAASRATCSATWSRSTSNGTSPGDPAEALPVAVGHLGADRPRRARAASAQTARMIAGVPAWKPHATFADVTTCSSPASSVTSSPRSALRSTDPRSVSRHRGRRARSSRG